MIYIGAGNIYSPLGSSIRENWENLLAGKTAIRPYSSLKPEDPPLYLSRFEEKGNFYTRIFDCIDTTLLSLADQQPDWSKTVLIFSSTKADIEQLESRNIEQSLLDYTCTKLQEKYPAKTAITVSNACISGITALLLAHDLIKTGQYENALVVAADNCSTFVSEGFKSFYAIASDFCKPYDANRQGINLGEGVASAFVSSNRNLFTNTPTLLLGGASANDANHISGPSRTGEGLFRATKRALEYAGKSPEQINYISAHGTATRYNDDMESMAIDRLNLNAVPVNSLKGYFGHTLGAAGLIETLVTIEQMNTNLILGTKGLENPGTVKPINVFPDTIEKHLNTVLKSGSGFGGCNAAIVLEKLK